MWRPVGSRKRRDEPLKNPSLRRRPGICFLPGASAAGGVSRKVPLVFGAFELGAPLGRASPMRVRRPRLEGEKGRAHEKKRGASQRLARFPADCHVPGKLSQAARDRLPCAPSGLHLRISGARSQCYWRWGFVFAKERRSSRELRRGRHHFKSAAASRCRIRAPCTLVTRRCFTNF